MSNTTSAPVHPVDQPHNAGRIHHVALLAVIWSLAGLCALFVATRLAIQLRFARRLYVDDGLIVLALSILIANSVVATLMAPAMYQILELAAGLYTPDAGFMARATFYLKCQFASTVLFWTCLWAVKSCFLAFFWRLTSQLRWPRRAWWLAVALTAAGYITSVITYPVSCTSFVLGECETSRNIMLSLVSLRYSTAVDMATDFSIILIPLWLTIGLKMSLSQKLALSGVLCLGVITMVFATIRIIVTDTTGVHPDITWLALWSAIESSIAVIVACLTSFRVLFTQLRKGSSHTGPSGNRRPYDHSLGSKRFGQTPKKSIRSSVQELHSLSEEDMELEKIAVRGGAATTACVGGTIGRATSSASDQDWVETASLERILPSEAIRVQTTWRVART